MNAEGEKVPTRVRPAPLGGYFSYQMAPTEGNFKVACNVDFSKQRNSDSVPITIYPSLPVSYFPPCLLSHGALHSISNFMLP